MVFELERVVLMLKFIKHIPHYKLNFSIEVLVPLELPAKWCQSVPDFVQIFEIHVAIDHLRAPSISLLRVT